MYNTHRRFFLRGDLSGWWGLQRSRDEPRNRFGAVMISPNDGWMLCFFMGLLWVMNFFSYEFIFIMMWFSLIFRGFPIKLLSKIARFSSVNFQVKSPRSRTETKTRDHTIHPQSWKKKSAVLKKMMVYFPKKLSQKWWCISQSWCLEDDDPAFLFGDTFLKGRSFCLNFSGLRRRSLHLPHHDGLRVLRKQRPRRVAAFFGPLKRTYSCIRV